MAVTKISARELVNAPFPELPLRLSQRGLSSHIQTVSARTVSAFNKWHGFSHDVADLGATLDDTNLLYLPPMECFGPLRPSSDETDIRHALEDLFIALDPLVNLMNIPFKFMSVGSGRTYSCTDIVLLDISATQEPSDRPALSARVYGNGEAKGPWQFKMLDSEELENALEDSKQVKKVTETIQQLFGDMVLDESKYGFVSNYNQTIFFRRAPNASVKALDFSPVIKIKEAPLAAFLFVLVEAYNQRGDKIRLGRSGVPDTPTQGYVLRFPRVTQVTSRGRPTRRPHTVTVRAKRARSSRAAGVSRREDMWTEVSDFYSELFTYERLDRLPAYSMEEIGLTGRVIGVGRYGNVLEGKNADGVLLALKTFNFYKGGAMEAFVREQTAYKALMILQGECVPFLFAVGRIPHCNVGYLALADCGTCNLKSMRLTHTIREKVTQSLVEIHQLGVLHNDLRPSNILLCDGVPKFIDFEESVISDDKEAFQNENVEMEDMLDALLAVD